MKIALDPTPFHHDYELLEFPRVVADLGYEYLQLTPHRDFIPFFNHPRADDELVAKFRKACADAGVGIASVLPVLRWSGPDEDAREAAVRNWKRVIQITVDLGVNVINTEFSGRPERAEESERAFFRSVEELVLAAPLDPRHASTDEGRSLVGAQATLEREVREAQLDDPPAARRGVQHAARVFDLGKLGHRQTARESGRITVPERQCSGRGAPKPGARAAPACARRRLA